MNSTYQSLMPRFQFDSLNNYGQQPANSNALSLMNPEAFAQPEATGGFQSVAAPAPYAVPLLNDYGASATAADTGILGGLFKNFGSTKNADGTTDMGWGTSAMGLAQAGVGLYSGLQQYGMAKKQLEEGKRQYDANYAAQKTTTNAQLEDRQRARVASNAGAYDSVGNYMNQNGIK